MQISFHTDAFNSAAWSFEDALEWAQDHDVHRIECGVISGPNWLHGLGYHPHIALYEDPLTMKKKMADYGVQFSQIDAAYPLSGLNGPVRGVPYVLESIPWASHAGCPRIATTDGLHAPEKLSDEEAMTVMQRSYAQILEVAEQYGIHINIELHGYFTTNPDMLERMLNFVDSPYLGLNFDTGNTFISGQDPVDFLRRFVGDVNHVHIKDVSESLAAAARGEDTGIGISHCSIGEGVNADNIRECLKILRDNGYDGPLSLECEGKGGPVINKSLEWVRTTLDELDIPRE